MGCILCISMSTLKVRDSSLSLELRFPPNRWAIVFLRSISETALCRGNGSWLWQTPFC